MTDYLSLFTFDTFATDYMKMNDVERISERFISYLVLIRKRIEEEYALFKSMYFRTKLEFVQRYNVIMRDFRELEQDMERLPDEYGRRGREGEAFKNAAVDRYAATILNLIQTWKTLQREMAAAY